MPQFYSAFARSATNCPALTKTQFEDTDEREPICHNFTWRVYGNRNGGERAGTAD